MLLALVVTEAVAIALLAVLVVGLLRSHGDVLRTLHKLGAGLDPDAEVLTTGATPVAFTPRRPVDAPAGTAARLTGLTLDGEAVSWPVADAGRNTLLAFLSSGCETCLPFWQQLSGEVEVPGDAELVVVTGGPERESETLLHRLAPAGLPVVMSTQAWEDYEVPGSPHFVFVDGATGTIAGEGTAPTWPQVASLLERAVGDLARRSAPRPRASADATVMDRDAPDRVDAELAAAGIGAGHPSLWTDPHGAAGSSSAATE